MIASVSPPAPVTVLGFVGLFWFIVGLGRRTSSSSIRIRRRWSTVIAVSFVATWTFILWVLL